MGMYTEFHFNSRLKTDTPPEVIEILKFMTSDRAKPEVLPEHPLFECDRWVWMLKCTSYYFDQITHSVVERDEVNNDYYLSIRCDLKNYDGEIEKFCDWIEPYLDKIPGEFLGFSRYEEIKDPTLIYYKKETA